MCGDQVTKVFRNLRRVPSVFRVNKYVDAHLPGSNRKSDYNGRELELWEMIKGSSKPAKHQRSKSTVPQRPGVSVAGSALGGDSPLRNQSIGTLKDVITRLDGSGKKPPNITVFGLNHLKAMKEIPSTLTFN